MIMGRPRMSHLHLPQRMRFKHGAYYYDYGKRKSPEGRTYEWLSRDLKEAKLKWARIEAEDVEPASGTFAALAKAYQSTVLLDKSKATQRLHTICLVALVKSFGHMKVTAIQPHHIYAHMDAYPFKVAANRQLAAMSNVFNLGIRKGLLSVNPCRSVSRNKETPRDRYIEDHEFQAVKALASPLFAAVMDFAYMTAMRKGDILSLRMDKITEDGISVQQGKTGKRQLIEWTPALRECVERLKAIGPPLRPTLVCTRRGKQYSASGFSGMWHELRGQAMAQGVKRFTFHDLRAKAISDGKTQGLDPQRLAGHTTAKQTATYLRSKEIDRIQPVEIKF